MSTRTIYLSKLFGLFCLLIGLAMVANKQATLQTIEALLRDAPMTFLAGVIALGVGLAMVLGHNVWSGGALPVIVTVVGWLSLIKGLLMLVVPPGAMAGLYLGEFHLGQYFYEYVAVLLILGLYLAYQGFRSKPR